MPKINQEEYEVLKDLDDKWKWIARDESGSCFIFELKPIKDNRYELWEWVGNTNIDKIFDSSLFQFIQWDDSEPHNIQELIEEYEYSTDHVSHVVNERVKALGNAWKESEETEVKSIQDLIDKWDNYKNVARTVANSRAIEHADMFINDLEQLDEPEAPKQEEITEEQAWEVLSELYDIPNKSYIREAMRVVANYVGDDMTIGELKERISKPTVPPQKYQVKDNHGRTLLAKMTYSYKGKTFEEVQPYNELIVGYEKELTEQEIKDYDSRFWPFAVKVEELEE